MADQHASLQSGANLNSLSPANLRQRPLGRAATFAEASPSKYRRNSAISDTVSEARQSIRDSTDDLLFPRAKAAAVNPRIETHHDSHWQSAPLALALLPAVGGMFFDNGSAFVTDATLLILAAVFLNWSVRLPWYVLPYREYFRFDVDKIWKGLVSLSSGDSSTASGTLAK